jgi:hypothetical protein
MFTNKNKQISIVGMDGASSKQKEKDTNSTSVLEVNAATNDDKTKDLNSLTCGSAVSS